MKNKAARMVTLIGFTIYIIQIINLAKKRTMKNNLFTFAIIGLIAGTCLSGCGKTSEQKNEGTKENVEEIKQGLKDAQTDYLMAWQKFKSESEITIAANEKRIDTLKGKIEKVDSKVKAKYRKDVAALEKKNSSLKKQLEEYKNEGRDKWEVFKMNFKNDLDGIGKTMKDLFKDKDPQSL
jgi:hypothetical protein